MDVVQFLSLSESTSGGGTKPVLVALLQLQPKWLEKQLLEHTRLPSFLRLRPLNTSCCTLPYDDHDHQFAVRRHDLGYLVFCTVSMHSCANSDCTGPLPAVDLTFNIIPHDLCITPRPGTAKRPCGAGCHEGYSKAVCTLLGCLLLALDCNSFALACPSIVFGILSSHREPLHHPGTHHQLLDKLSQKPWPAITNSCCLSRS